MLYCSNSLSDITTIFNFLCTQELKNWKITDSHILAHFNCSKCVYILKIYFLGNALVCFKFLASSFSLLRPSDYFTNSIQITKHIKKISFFFLNSFVIIWKYSIWLISFWKSFDQLFQVLWTNEWTYSILPNHYQFFFPPFFLHFKCFL